MEIPFHITWAFHPDANSVENAQALQILLDCMVKLNRAYRRSHVVPALYQSGVRYRRTRLWEPIPALYARGYGDCKSLACALISEYLEQGVWAVPVFRGLIRDTDGNTDFHILVQTERGPEDPSKVLGMRKQNAHSPPID